MDELKNSIAAVNSTEEAIVCLKLFMEVEKNEDAAIIENFYFKLWPIALLAGKLVLAKTYADKAMQLLIAQKRIPQIKALIKAFKEAGIHKNKMQEYEQILCILQGKPITDFERIEMLSDHPEHWKYSKQFLNQYLFLSDKWDIEHWKYCYEFILINGFSSEIFLALLNKAQEKNDHETAKKLKSLLQSKGLIVPKDRAVSIPQKEENITNLYVDYDEIAMNVMSGSNGPGIEEQERVINSLKFISDEELIARGKEMAVAFSFLGMEQAVISLCERTIKLISDVKQRASIFYVWGQALMNSQEYYKAIELIEAVITKEPLYGNETHAFLYLKAEACLKLNKLQTAKETYLEIKKENPNFRLIKERLKHLEKYK